MSILHVLLDGAVVAELDDAAGDGMAALRYTDECLGAYPVGSPLLSVRLPVRAAPYPGGYTRPWLDGLLPEGDVRDILAARAKLDRTDLVGFLRVYGRDCAGAVSVVDPDGDPDAPAGVAWLTRHELEQAVRDLPRAPFGVSATRTVRVSLGGIQGKLAVVVDGDRIGLPEGLQPSTHILKPSPLSSDGDERYPGIVTGEAVCMRLFHHLGLATAEVGILDLATGPALLVTRYDRVAASGLLTRLHQEDLCQALGIPSVGKYQDNSLLGTPTLLGLIGQLRGYQAATVPVLREVLGRVFANALVTNCDAHGKNWSFMLSASRVSLAPVYDVVPSTLWPDVNTDLAMFVGGCAAQSDLRADHILAEAAGWGLGRRAAGAVLGRLRDEVPAALERASADVESFNGSGSVIDRVADIVNAQLRVLVP